jgi:hypothetical protein
MLGTTVLASNYGMWWIATRPYSQILLHRIGQQLLPREIHLILSLNDCSIVLLPEAINSSVHHKKI